MQFEIYDSSNIHKISASTKLEIFQLDMQLEEQCWSRKIWQETWDDFGHFLLQLALVEGKVIGFSLWTLPPLEEVMHLLKVVVQDEQRRHGTAAKMFNQMLVANPMKGVYLEVKVSNTNAVAFYQKLGLKIMTKTRNYYGTGKDGYKMFKPALPNG